MFLKEQLEEVVLLRQKIKLDILILILILICLKKHQNVILEQYKCNKKNFIIIFIQSDGFCAAKFIMKNLPGRIEALSDVESVA